MRWAIVADDLTGAADAAVAFADRGWDTTVWLQPPTAFPDNACTAIDADARWRSVKLASHRIAQQGRMLKSADWFLLKIDSTLRGFVGAMVEAAWHSTQRRWALIAPAVPQQGRIVQDGKAFVRGKPLAETPLATEPPAPITSSCVGERLIATGLSSERVMVVPLPIVRHPKALLQAMQQAVEERKALVCDAVTDADLRRVVRVATQLPHRPLFVGASGLAHAIAAFSAEKRSKPSLPLPFPHKCQVLVLVGSQQPTAQQQLACLAAKGVAVRSLEENLCAFDDSSVIALWWATSERHPSLPHAKRFLQQWAQNWLANAPFQALVLVGGFTARAVLEALGIVCWQLWGSVVAGVPFGVATNCQGQKWFVATKAGGFGTRQTLWRVVRRLCKMLSVD